MDFMPHQALQDLQRYTGIQHVHRIGMAERMWRDRDRERHTVSGSGGNRLPNQVLTVLSVTSQIRAFSGPACSFYYAVPWGFSVCHHRLQLADNRGVGERNQPVSLLTGKAFFLPSGGFFGPLFQGRKLHKRIQARKNPHVSASASLIARTVFPAWPAASFAVQIRHVVEQGADFRQPAGIFQFVLNIAIWRSASAAG